MRHTMMVVSSDPLASVACRKGDLEISVHIDCSWGDIDQEWIRPWRIEETDNIKRNRLLKCGTASALETTAAYQLLEFGISVPTLSSS